MLETLEQQSSFLNMHFLKSTFFIILLAITSVSCTKETESITASAKIYSLIDGEQMGTFFAIYKNGKVSANIRFEGIYAGRIQAVHLHDGTCESIEGHWNQGSEDSFCEKLSLGVPWEKPYAGDFGNITIGEDGFGDMTVLTDLWTIGTDDERDINDKVIIIHSQPSDFMAECDPNHIPDHTHNSQKMGCGVITISK